MTNLPSAQTLLPFVTNDTHNVSREIKTNLCKFLNTLIYIRTMQFSFETQPEDFHTALLILEHLDTYFSFVDTHSLNETLYEPQF